VAGIAAIQPQPSLPNKIGMQKFAGRDEFSCIWFRDQVGWVRSISIFWIRSNPFRVWLWRLSDVRWSPLSFLGPTYQPLNIYFFSLYYILPPPSGPLCAGYAVTAGPPCLHAHARQLTEETTGGLERSGFVWSARFRGTKPTHRSHLKGIFFFGMNPI
jgi:hypothetical protein